MPDFIPLNGRLLHYRFRTGDGAVPVVFANSLGTDFRIWDTVIAQLSSDTPVLQVDKSGHGLSEGGAASIQDHADDLIALMDRLNISASLVCGVSVGGMIAQALAASRPDLAAGLVLCNTGYRIGTADAWDERIATVKTDGLAAMADGILERWFSERFRQNMADTTLGYRMMLSRTPTDGYAAICAAIRDADLERQAATISCPTLCVAGSEDQATPPEVVQALSDCIQGSDFQLIEGVGHIPSIEAPDRLSTLLRQRLEMIH